MAGPVLTLDEFTRHVPEFPFPSVAVDPLGATTVVWQAYDGTFLRIKAVHIDASGVPRTVHTLSPPEAEAWDHQVAVDSTGRATVVWRLPSVDKVQAVRLEPDGTPEEVQTLAESTGARIPALAVGPEGPATVAWPSEEGIQAVRIDASGTPGEPEVIPSTVKSDGTVKVVVDSLGRATLAWSSHTFPGPHEIKSVRLDSEGTPGTVETLTPPEKSAYEPQLAVDSENHVTAAWQDFQNHIDVVRFDEAGAPGTPVPVSGELVAGQPQVAAEPGGGAVVVWTYPSTPFAPEEECLEGGFDPKSDAVFAAFLDAEGQPEEVRAVSAFGEQSQFARVAVDPLGQPTFVWESFDGTYFCPDIDIRIQYSRGTLPVPPKPKPPVPEEPSPPPAPKLGVLSVSRRGLVKDLHLALPARCTSPDGLACSGEVKLTVQVSDIPLQLRRSLRHLPRHRRQVTLARDRYQLAPGGRSRLSLSLTGFGRQLAAKGKGQLLSTIARGSAVNPAAVLVRLPRNTH
ncbi:MAG TPA: hypothetical protein VFX44_00315 [Solirubrobacterales bacterium]|nr:hypothetical protein [Solirubrobacterales bacterium]